MCKFCTKRLTYAQIYDEAFRCVDKEKWLIRTLNISRSFCLRHKKYALKHIVTAVNTQRIFEKVSPESKQQLYTESVLTSKQLKLPLKKIQHKVLNHLYRPKGYMFKKSLGELESLLM